MQQRANPWTWGEVLPMTYLINYNNHVSAPLFIQSNSDSNSAHYKYKKNVFWALSHFGLKMRWEDQENVAKM